MTEELRGYIIKLFAKCIAFAFVFLIVSMVGGLIAGRLLGVTVEADKIWSILGSAFTMILAAAIGIVSGGGKPSAKESDESK